MAVTRFLDEWLPHPSLGRRELATEPTPIGAGSARLGVSGAPKPGGLGKRSEAEKGKGLACVSVTAGNNSEFQRSDLSLSTAPKIYLFIYFL